jgi:hypothetical protein
MDDFTLIDDLWFEPNDWWLDFPVFNPWDEYEIPTDVIGDPYNDAGVWHQQQTPFTCAVVSQEMILNAFGIEVSEAELIYEATSRGWLTENGTSPEDVGELLELYGIGTHTGEAGGVESLIEELRRGHKVIVGVDSGELLNQEWAIEDLFPWDGADHAVMVTGLDMNNPDNPMVILNDPGHSEGAGMEVPWHQFVNAWNDSGQTYIATDDAPPDLNAHSLWGANFNYATDGTGQYMDDEFWEDCINAAIGGGLIGAFAATGDPTFLVASIPFIDEADLPFIDEFIPNLDENDIEELLQII